MKYRVIQGKTLLELEDRIANWIKDGWKPQGGVSTGDTHGSYVVSPYYIQAMVKE